MENIRGKYKRKYCTKTMEGVTSYKMDDQGQFDK